MIYRLMIVVPSLALGGPIPAQDETDGAPFQAFQLNIRALCAANPDNPTCAGTLEATCGSDEGDVCTCGGGKTCQSTETGCACLAAERDRAQIGTGSDALAVGPPVVVGASIDVTCGADVYT